MIESPRFTDRAYARMLLNLFPQGSAFPRDEKNSLFTLLLGLAQELFRLDVRANKIVKESEPGEAEELIGEYETDLAIPASCFGVPYLLADRRHLAEFLTVFPVNLETGFHRYATITAGSDIINISGNTDTLLIGDSLLISFGFTGGKYKVIESLGSGDFRMEQTAERSAAAIQVKGYFTRAEQSERFYRQLAIYLGYEITSFSYYVSFEMGGDLNGWDETGDTTLGSNRISNISDTAGIKVNEYVILSAGFDVLPRKVSAVGADYIDVEDEAGALSSLVGISLTGYHNQPFGMGDAIGDAWRFAVKIKYHRVTALNDDLLPCVFGKLKPAHVHFVFEIDS